MNSIIRRLPSAEQKRVLKQLRPVPLAFKEVIYEQDRPVSAIYFPTAGVISLLTLVEEHEIEAGTVGREGMAGLPAFLGMPAPGRAIVQVPGRALRMSVAAFKAELARNGELPRLLLRYTHAVMAMFAQSAACNRAHALEARMARWLLTTHDRVDGDDFPLTQEFLGQMLGVRRPAVSLAASALQRGGLITYSRGRIRVTDRAGLENASCECHGHVRRIMSDALD